MNKKRLTRFTILLIAVLTTQSLALAGCSQGTKISWLRDRSQDYKTAKHCPGLVIPKGMPVDTFSDTYDIPND